MTMSKPIVRVAFVLLISLTLIAATYMTVQGGARLKTETVSVQSHGVGGLQTNLNHDRLSSAEVQGLQMQSNFQSGNGSGHDGGCHSDSHLSPQD
jgi:hypothetical protein